MVTLDDVERAFTSEMALVCDGEGPSGIAGIMGGQVSEVSDKTTRVLMEAATWVGPEHHAHLQGARAAHRGLGALREAAAPRAGDRGAAAGRAADGRAVRGAAGAGDGRRVPAAGAAARRRRCATSGSRGCSARRSSPTTSHGILERLGFEPRRTAAGVRAAVARQRRPARGRPDRGGRARPRPRQAARPRCRRADRRSGG